MCYCGSVAAPSIQRVVIPNVLVTSVLVFGLSFLFCIRLFLYFCKWKFKRNPQREIKLEHKRNNCKIGLKCSTSAAATWVIKVDENTGPPGRTMWPDHKNVF